MTREREPWFSALEEARRGLRASRDRRGERDAEIIRDLAVAGLQALDSLDWGNRAPDWRESDVVKQARTMLAQIGTPLWPGLTESDWAEVLRGVLAERDFIGDWLQRFLDAESVCDRSAVAQRGGPHDPQCAYIVTSGAIICDCPPRAADSQAKPQL